MHTAGAFKRTLTTLGENTDEGRQKFKSDLEDLHLIFKNFVKEQRPQVDTEIVATGEVWQGEDAFLFEAGDSSDLSEKLAFSMQLIMEKSLIKFYDLINRDRFTS